jgi:RimJ/RimL family protein N-acetyltransferase
VAGFLTTQRMLIRQFNEADAGWLAALHGDPAVMRYIDDGQPVPPAVVADTTLPGILDDYLELPDGMGCFAAAEKYSGAPLGWFGLGPPSSAGLNRQASDTAEVGYRLFPAAWGCGYATEGAKAMIRQAFTALDVEQVVATTMTVNIGSRRVMQKAGLSLVRTFFVPWPSYLDGAEHGDVEYAISRRDWARQA